MLSSLTRRCRRAAAAIFAALYAICLVVPAAALAFVDAPTALHCFTDQHGIAAAHDHDATVHVHADGTTHRHADEGTNKPSDNGGRSHPADCCGLFCMTALATEASVQLGTPVHFRFAAPALDEDVAGRGPDRINRPPIA
jgi:hypothetical protein